MPTPKVVITTPTALAATPTRTPRTATPSTTPRVRILVGVLHKEGPGVYFSECVGFDFYEWGPRSDYDVVAWSPDGSELYFTSRGDVHGVRADGSRLWLVVSPRPPDADPRSVGRQTWFAVSPDGSNLVYTACLARPADMDQFTGVADVTHHVPHWPQHYFELFRVAPDGTSAVRLTDNGGFVDFYPAWSPDGQRIAYLSDAGVTARYAHALRMRLYTMAADGTDVRPALGDEFAMLHQPPQWSPDGRHLAVVRYIDEAYPGGITLIGRELYVVSLHGPEPRRVATDVVSGPSWSPDGQRLAYARANAGGVALYSVHIDGTHETRVSGIPRWQEPNGFAGPSDPAESWIDIVAWSPDGTRILVGSNPSHPAFVVNLETGQTIEIGFAQAFRPDGPLEGMQAAAWSPDGSRIGLLARGFDTYDVDGPGMVATVAADGTDLRVLAEREKPLNSNSKLLPQGGRYVPRPEDEAACRTGGAVPNPEANEELVVQCVALIVFQKTLAGGEALNWSPERPMAEWDGVVVGGRPLYVRAIDLRSRGLRGVLPVDALQLHGLHTLVLSNNSLEGRIPSFFGYSSSLEILDFGNNRFTGPIPPELRRLAKLRRLDLSSNQFSGDIPPELADLPNLEEVALAGNQFTGCVPPGLPLRDRDDLDLPTCEAAT